MCSYFWERDPDNWHQDKVLIREFRLNENKYMVNDNSHIDSETDVQIYRSIQIQRSYKTQKGRWYYSGEKINIPFDKFPEFCRIIQEINEKEYHELLNSE